jgi:hypothetical protein
VNGTCAPDETDPLGALALHARPGGCGNGTRVVDVEHGWRLDHPGLAHVDRIRHLAGDATPIGADHGTAVLGLVAGRLPDGRACGSAPGVALGVATPWRRTASGDPRYDLAHTLHLLAADPWVRRGDVVLIELAFAGPSPDAPQLPQHLPADHDPAVARAIRTLVARGVVVVLPAGNGDVDLDALPWPSSGAIVVGASTGSTTNYGDGVDTTAPGWPQPTLATDGGVARTGGTSAAAARVAAVIAQLQGTRRAVGRPPLGPHELRRLLGGAAVGVRMAAGGPL